MISNNDIVPLEEDKANRPPSSAFKQQKLSAWQPILTAGTVLPTFFLVGVAFIPIGIGLLISSYQVQEYEIDYTSCIRSESKSSLSLNSTSTSVQLCSEYIDLHGGPCKCQINFDLDSSFRRDVFLYYGLVNFYQNHRRYVKSRDDYQLLGRKIHDAGAECEPFRFRIDASGQKKPIMPCGAIANSYFNDSFILERLVKDEKTPQKTSYRTVPLVKTGIAWATDKKHKFHNPPLPASGSLAEAFNGTCQPRNWKRPIYELETKDPTNNGLENEAFIIWMRTAAFPTFKKVFARIAHDKRDNDIDYQDGLPKGQYRLIITYNFPVAEFKAKKRFIISNTSWLGGRNPFIGALYIIIGVFSLIFSAIFLIIQKKQSRNAAENLNITIQTPFLAVS